MFIDSNAENYDFKLKEGAIIKAENVKYEVLKTEDNTSNGMQAIPVAPVKDGAKDEADTSEIVIAYVGTTLVI